MAAYLVVDLSNNNGSVDFERLARGGHFAGVYLKRSEGADFVDRTFDPFAAEARKHGLRVGAYHFAHPGRHNAEDEAAFFAKLMKGQIGRLDFRPALDLEVEQDAGGAWSRRFSRAVRQALGLYPLFYSYPAFISAMQPKSPIGAGLWLASYGRNDGAEYPYAVPAPWKHVALHQFTSNGRVPGVAGGADISSAPSLRPLLAHPVTGRLPRLGGKRVAG